MKRLIEIFENIENRSSTLGKDITICKMSKGVESLQCLWRLGLPLFRELNHYII